MAAGMFTISYSCAVIVPILSGLAWDLTGVPAAAFVPMALSVLVMIGLASTLGLSSRTPATTWCYFAPHVPCWVRASRSRFPRPVETPLRTLLMVANHRQPQHTCDP